MNYAINALTRSLNVFHLAGSACNNCDIEILDALTPRYDLERFGITLVGSIRHADVLLLSGVFNKKGGHPPERTARPGAQNPTWSSPSAAVPATGLMFRDSYNWDTLPGEYVHIDAFIPGCPPKPEAIISGVVKVDRGAAQRRTGARFLQDKTCRDRAWYPMLPARSGNEGMRTGTNEANHER